jgi:methionyl-tRNA formyltransferase
MSKKLRVLFFTHDSLYASRVLAELLTIPTIEIAGVVLSTAIMRRGKGPLRDGLKLLTTSGARYTLYLIKTTVFYKKLAKQFSVLPLKTLIKQNKLPTINTNNVNTRRVENFIHEKTPDLGVTAFFNQLLSPHLLELPKQGFINLHPSLLPTNRGVDPVFYAYLRREDDNGVTIHRLDKSLDTGNILLQASISMNFEQSLLMNQWHHFDQGSLLMREVLMDIDRYLPGSLQKGAGNYDSWPLKRAIKDIANLL